ncbi:hypothetical protein H8356DRAFT_1435621 [Neocallimastix lanati (nom. inval.)]|nr:hypothetical protein H8356DRAFT_1435621 [Neocallimastix sp. JGI-2020a]
MDYILKYPKASFTKVSISKFEETLGTSITIIQRLRLRLSLSNNKNFYHFLEFLDTDCAEYLSTKERIKKVLQIENLFNIEEGHLNSKLRHTSDSYHFNNKNVSNKNDQLKYINSNDMLVDTLTRNINENKISNFTNKIFIE